MLAEALAEVEKVGEGSSEAELYRLKGKLTLQKSKAASHQLPSLQSRVRQAEAEAKCISRRPSRLPVDRVRSRGAAGGDEPQPAVATTR